VHSAQKYANFLPDTYLVKHKKISTMPSMNYNNYEGQIVENFGIELVNFPGGTVVQPGTLPHAQLQQLIVALEHPVEADHCRWVTLSPMALQKRIKDNQARQARGEQVYKRRKCGTGRKKSTKSSSAKSSEFVEDEEEVENDEAEEEDN
jgi:hypothetical protein